uniref:Sodium/potassium-transporting ATPase subunit beta-1 n=2 Tax=Parascaris univalens TaxID=6257 RepID=A0A915AJD0_PARUN
MATLRYERVSDPEGATVIDHVSVYNPEQIDDTAAIIGRNGEIESAFSDPISFREIFYDPRLSPKQQKFCIATILSVACITVLMLISLFAGFGKVLFDITAREERATHGLLMIPNLRSRPMNVLFYDQFNKSANIENYAKEIDEYLSQYRDSQEYMRTYLKRCSPEERSDDEAWCLFDIEQEFGTACSKYNNYGYDNDQPCILFAFEDRLNWTPTMQSSNYYLPFLCRMQYQFSSNVFANISYFPSLPGSARNGGFYLNQIPNRTLKDIEGKNVVEKDGDIMYSLPPLLMVKLSFPKELGPFTIDCRIKDNISGYEFNNLNTFKGQISVSFDFIPENRK